MTAPRRKDQIVNARRAALSAHLATFTGTTDPTTPAASYGLDRADVERIIRNRSL